MDIPIIEEFTLKDSTSTSMTLTWSEISGVDKYELDIPGQTFEIPPGSSQFTISELKPGQKYKLTMQAVKRDKKGPKCQLSESTDDAEPVKALQVKESTFSTVTLCWSEISNVESYQVTKYFKGGKENIVTKSNCHEFHDLEPSCRYSFDVCVVIDDIKGPVTSVDTSTMDIPMIEEFTLKDSTSTSMTLTWSEISGVDKYELDIPGQTFEIPPGSSQFTISELKPGQKYKLTMQAVKRDKKGPKCQLSESTDDLPQVRHFKAKCTHSSVKLTWDAVDDIEQFKIETAGKENPLYVQACEKLIPDLVPNEEYSFEICAMKGQYSGHGTTLDATTKDIPKIEEFKVLECTLSSVSLTWQQLNDVEEYCITCPGREEVLLDSQTTEYIVTGLKPRQNLRIGIYAMMKKKKGSEVNVDAQTKEIQEVSNFGISKSSFSTVNLSWNKMADVDNYQIILGEGNKSWHPDALESTLVVENLTPKTTYTFNICAVIAGESGPTTEIIATTTDLPEVEDVIVLEQSLVSVTLSWLPSFNQADKLEIGLDEKPKESVSIRKQEYGMRIEDPKNQHKIQISSLTELGIKKSLDFHINPKDIPEKRLGDPVSFITVRWKQIEGIDKYEINGTLHSSLTNSCTFLNHSPGKDFTISLCAVKGDTKSKVVKITSKAQYMEYYTRYRFHEFLRLYGLYRHLETPISMHDLLLIKKEAIHEEAPKKPEDLPWYIFHKIMMLNYKARSAQIETKTVQSNVFENIDISVLKAKSHNKDIDESATVHPIDLFLAMFLCSDMFVQQYFVTKLSQCQLALPLLIHNPNDFRLCLPLWAFRQIKKSWSMCLQTNMTDQSEIYDNQHMVDAKSKIISFIRFGSSKFSKSALMNSILSQSHEIFIHRDSKGSTKARILVDGTAEMSWYLPSGKKKDVFSELVTFVNLRGDANECETQCKFLSSISTALVVVLSKGDDLAAVTKKIENFSSTVKVMYIIVDLQNQMTKSDRGWFFGVKALNKSEITEVIQQSLQTIVTTTSRALSLKDCVVKGKQTFGINCDEDNKQCMKGKEMIDTIMTEINKIEHFETAKDTLLPLQGSEWHQWSETEKRKCRPKFTEGNESIIQYKEKHSNDLEKLRKKQSKKGLPPNSMMNSVISFLSRDLHDVMFFLQWMKFELEKLSAKKLVKLNDEFNNLWHENERLKEKMQNDLKANKLQQSQKEQTENEIKDVAKQLHRSNEKITSSSIGTEHFLREISQMYECAMDIRKIRPNLTDTYEDTIRKLPSLAADLLLNGQAIELMDGDAGHVPTVWISNVLSIVSEKTQNARVFVLTVLGIQSSGKSTLLNAMFGLQFTVSAGRCTRGAYMQLLKVSKEMSKKLTYDLILVIDTEGLRSSELYTTTMQTRDNELATFAIGIGDVTLLNIFGENPSDINDILQIVVQAFLRMKRVNIKPRCYFVHQNVGAVDAKEKLKAGRRNMIDKLNEVTRVAAEQESSYEQFFSEVIAFDQEENFCYLSTLWEGDPPMAPPNSGYSEKVQNLKSVLLNLPAKENIPCLTINNIKERINDLWKALISENFVFNFKDTLEISVYRQVEAKFNQWKWQLYRCVEKEQDKALNIIDNARGDGSKFLKVQTEIQRAVEKTYEVIRKEALDYFENSDQKHVSIQWKEKTMIELQSLKTNQVHKANAYCEEFMNGQMARNKIEQVIADTENIFFQKAKDLAKEIRPDTGEMEKRREFDSAWKQWLQGISFGRHTIDAIDVWLVAEHCVLRRFESHSYYINQKLSNCNLKLLKVFVPELNVHYCIPRRGITKQLTSKFKEFFIPTNMCAQVSAIARSICELCDSHLKTIKATGVTKYKPGADNYFTDDIRFVKEYVDSENRKLKHFQLTEVFTLDLVLLVVSKTAWLLEDLHQQYVRKHDPKRIIDDKKKDIYDIFLKHVDGTNAGIVASEIWIQKIRDSVWNSFMQKSTATIKAHVMANTKAFNGNRSKLDLHMKQHLVQNENFQDYMTYIKAPKFFVETFVQRTINSEVLNKHGTFNHEIKRACTRHIAELYTRCSDAHKSATTQSTKAAIHYIEKFQELMKQYLSLGAAVDAFRGQANEITGKYVTCFHQELEERLPQVKNYCEEKLENLLKNEQELASIIATASTEVSEFFTEQCCWELCPFCKEMCTNTMNNHDGDHSVMFHKPQGLGGWYFHNTNIFVMEHCTHLVQTEKRFYPTADDEETLIEYKNYRKAGSPYNKWSITADESMQKHWQWFTAGFQKDIEDHFGKEIQEIPNSWKKISKNDVIKELQTTED